MVLLEGKTAKKLIERARLLARWDSPSTVLSEGSEVFVKVYDETIGYSFSLLNKLMEISLNRSCYFVVVNPDPYEFYHCRYGIFPVGYIENPADERTIKEIFFTNYDKREGYFADLKTIGDDWVILTDSNDWYIYGSRSKEIAILVSRAPLPREVDAEPSFETIDELRDYNAVSGQIDEKELDLIWAQTQLSMRS